MTRYRNGVVNRRYRIADHHITESLHNAPIGYGEIIATSSFTHHERTAVGPYRTKITHLYFIVGGRGVVP